MADIVAADRKTRCRHHRIGRVKIVRRNLFLMRAADSIHHRPVRRYAGPSSRVRQAAMLLAIPVCGGAAGGSQGAGSNEPPVTPSPSSRFWTNWRLRVCLEVLGSAQEMNLLELRVVCLQAGEGRVRRDGGRIVPPAGGCFEPACKAQVLGDAFTTLVVAAACPGAQ